MFRTSLVAVLATTFIVSSQPAGVSVAGRWAYKPIKKEKERLSVYPPEFVHLTLAKEGDGLRGSFSARFKVPNKSVISPDVNFDLKSIDETAQHFSWRSANGDEGTFTIDAVEGNALRIEWRRTKPRFQQGTLDTGQATLVRQ